ncbi:hypothetical protein [Williamsia sterculiae]|uniref:Excreted virulence factor EspC, type VII ESX diderm n=1 Tax=Williamsia sterculiae TaxID=1344003 RepID=A0A1N7DU67_9NOCA|nr:hypothetical protein [Williamsia sterculiae]SIR79339.1 hypothetical protein SAMN05445060_0907 [Williamsia sterculiae]
MTDRTEFDPELMDRVGRRMTGAREPLRNAATIVTGTGFGPHALGEDLGEHGTRYRQGMAAVAAALHRLADETEELGGRVVAARAATLDADEEAAHAFRSHGTDR